MTNLSNRAKLRLRLAAGLIGGPNKTLKLDRKNFYPQMIDYLKKMSDEEKNKLKEYVDWLEDFENATPIQK